MRKAAKIILVILTVLILTLTILSLITGFSVLDSVDKGGEDGYQPGDVTAAFVIALGSVLFFFFSILFGIYAIIGIVCSIISFTKAFEKAEKGIGITCIVTLIYLLPGILFLVDKKKSAVPVEEQN